MTRDPNGPDRFVVWAPGFSESNGGAILLHLLCRRLNEAGETALLWPAERPPLWPNPGLMRGARRAFRYRRSGGDEAYSTGPFPNRLASADDIEGSIIVYPEMVAGNPIGGDRVVRWFLHRPGFHSGVVDYGPNELYFYVVEPFNDPSINPDSDNRLTLQWTNEVYRDEGRPGRQGSCYLMRHGSGRPLSHDLADSVSIEHLSHAGKAEEFNRRERFYSYDPYTFYLWYAAICGCIPIVVPEPGVPIETWKEKKEDRYGIAYGEEDIPRAVATRGLLLAKLRERRQTEDEMVAAFIAKCKHWYRSR